ncbi:MAG: hypothetical protein ACRDRB_00680 [Pseudonocardiaceae bacterium]
MIRGDRELLTELARLNREMAPLAMRIMDGSASSAEQHAYAERLITAGERLRRRAVGTSAAVIEGEIFINDPLALPENSVEPYLES